MDETVRTTTEQPWNFVFTIRFLFFVEFPCFLFQKYWIYKENPEGNGKAGNPNKEDLTIIVLQCVLKKVFPK